MGVLFLISNLLYTTALFMEIIFKCVIQFTNLGFPVISGKINV